MTLTDAKIICDSISPHGIRLTTFELTYPRIIHSELKTHRVFSSNSASSRAIPIVKMIDSVLEHTFIPDHWPMNKPGMSSDAVIADPSDVSDAKFLWLSARDCTIETVRRLEKLGVHKQITNRLLEPWVYITTIVSSTDYTNFFKLRCHSAAQPEIQELACKMREKYDSGDPIEMKSGDWHLPYITPSDTNVHMEKVLQQISVARCARVSYMRHTDLKNPLDDLAFHDRLMKNGHWSPFEHVATPQEKVERDPETGNFKGWIQYRKLMEE